MAEQLGLGENPGGSVPGNNVMPGFATENLEKLYDQRTYDPRQERNVYGFNELSPAGPLGASGNKKIQFPNPVNPYSGSKFDDSITNGLTAGGPFNDPDNLYIPPDYNGIPYPHMGQIAQTGNFGGFRPGDHYDTNTGPFIAVSQSIASYLSTAGQSFKYNT